MSRYDTNYMMEVYEDDFGNQYFNVAFKIQKDAPALAELYQLREAAVCPSNSLFTTRRLIATFADGRALIYPVPRELDVIRFATTLRANGALCLDYIGEEWSTVPGNKVQPGLAFRSTPYQGFPGRKTFDTGTFLYSSQIALDGLANLRLPFRVPNTDNDDLQDCQQVGMEDMLPGQGLCSLGDTITPRQYIIKALHNENANGSSDAPVLKTVIRQAKVSQVNLIIPTGFSIAPCSYCFGWQGERIAGIHNFLA